jgi:peptidase E
MDRQIFAFSGVLVPRPGERGNLPLVEHALDLGRTRWLWEAAVRVCYVPTAVGDDPAAVAAYQQVFAGRDDVDLSVLSLFPRPNVPDVRKHLLRQDVVLVEGGSLVNLLAVWRGHGLPEVLAECWEEGVVLAGSGAGSQCWHAGAPTDAWSEQLETFPDGLGLLPFSNAVNHHDTPQRRRRAPYRRMVARAELPGGYATEDGVGLHYVGTELAEAVTVRPGARAWRIEPNGRGGCTAQAVEARPI